MANVFISHRKADVALAEQLAQEVKGAGHEVWFDDWKIDIGDSIVERINEGVGRHVVSRALLFLVRNVGLGGIENGCRPCPGS
ncbi:hypothetical protein GMJAKD_02960 [Candidatus Electrothrix aarhusensis]